MPEFIAPIVSKVLSVIEERTPALLEAAGLEAFREFRSLGVTVNFPAVEAGPARTDFDDSSADCHQVHRVRITFAVDGGEPDEVTTRAEGYMRAIHEALAASWPADWEDVIAGANVTRLFVVSHDYGPLYEDKGAIVRYPAMEVLVEVREAWETGLEGI